MKNGLDLTTWHICTNKLDNFGGDCSRRAGQISYDFQSRQLYNVDVDGARGRAAGWAAAGASRSRGHGAGGRRLGEGSFLALKPAVHWLVLPCSYTYTAILHPAYVCM